VRPAEELFSAIQHAALRFRSLDNELGLSPARGSILATLRTGGPRRVSELARDQGVAQPTITKLVIAMEEEGLVTRRSDPSDRRGIIVDLTETGRSLARSSRARKIEWVAAAVSGADEPELEGAVAVACRLEEAACATRPSRRVRAATAPTPAGEGGEAVTAGEGGPGGGPGAAEAQYPRSRSTRLRSGWPAR
jgi:DNA-binding MarR family transcriptional regulator